ncbi:MAG: hypothetical protein JRN62_03360 [Nitrososphaerota archaeon]|jgi:hypothetical protein|nr:hypothetical protein [Nitrososphaerota archaeon]MDG6948636.1 hypothetical protein [Nitrososphaerota archaeon]
MPKSNISDESWVELCSKIDEAEVILTVARRKIRSENAKFNFRNFLRGFVDYVETIARFDASNEKPLDRLSDYDTVKSMAIGTMFTYGRHKPETRSEGDWVSATTVPYWKVTIPPKK